MIYLDTSAAMKLVRAETHSVELSTWLRGLVDQPVVSSGLLEVELLRATRRSAPERLVQAAAIVEGIDLVEISAPIRVRAAAYTDPNLRSLDAIHLATAEHVAALTAQSWHAFIAYDERLLRSALAAGLPAVAPGLNA